jgi:hypothetical protein
VPLYSAVSVSAVAAPLLSALMAAAALPLPIRKAMTPPAPPRPGRPSPLKAPYTARCRGVFDEPKVERYSS